MLLLLATQLLHLTASSQKGEDLEKWRQVWNRGRNGEERGECYLWGREEGEEGVSGGDLDVEAVLLWVTLSTVALKVFLRGEGDVVVQELSELGHHVGRPG